MALSARNPHGITPLPVIPGFWDSTGDLYSGVSQANPLPVSATVTTSAPVPPSSSSVLPNTTVAKTGVGTTTLLATEASSPQRRGATIWNTTTSGNNIYVLPTSPVTAATGFPIAPGQVLNVQNTGPLYACSDNGTETVAVFKEYT